MTQRTVFIGAHVSAAGGVDNAPRNAQAIGATALSLFTRNQRQWNAKPYDPETVDAFRAAMAEAGYTAGQAIPHASYLVNLGSTDDEIWEKSIAGLSDELSRTVQLGMVYLNFHPGTSKGEWDEETTLTRIAAGVDRVLNQVEGGILVLENTAGQGSAMGNRIEHLQRIIERSTVPERVAICIDTCHAFAAGYDIRTGDGWNDLMKTVETTTGLDKLVALHLNDSTGALGSRKDRHKPIGDGEIGMEGFTAIMHDTRLDGKPIILETPDVERWPQEIRMLKKIAGIDP